MTLFFESGEALFCFLFPYHPSASHPRPKEPPQAAFFYEIRSADKTFLKRDGSFPTQYAPKIAGRGDANKMKTSVSRAVSLFLLGAAVHFLLIRLLFHWLYAPSDSRVLVDNPIANGAFVVFGGAFYVLGLKEPLLILLRGDRPWIVTTMSGGIRGLVATFAALQVLLVGLACILTFKSSIATPGTTVATIFEVGLVALMDVETYGFIGFVYLLVPAFICGALITGLSGLISRRVAHA